MSCHDTGIRRAARRARDALPAEAVAETRAWLLSADGEESTQRSWPLAENPNRAGKALNEPCFDSTRRGGYRVIYSIDQDAHAVDSVHIDHHAVVYRTAGR